MTVNIMRITNHPLDVISSAAGCCYGKDNYSEKRVKTCFNKGHMSVFEHVSATFKVTDISRACTHQLVRHRIASYSQMSQRYTKLTYENLRNRDWYVTPPDILANPSAKNHYDNIMYSCLLEYLRSLEDGVKPEDARFMLPESAKTEIIVTMNLREIYHFMNVRYSHKAQWEIQGVAKDLFEQLNTHCHDRYEWEFLMNLWEMKRER